MSKTFIEKKYKEFINKKGYFPIRFNPYNSQEIKEVAPALTTQCGGTTSSATVLIKESNRIRRLTPRECFRLQGFPDELYEKARKVSSDSQLFKQAGNAVTVNLAYSIALTLKNSMTQE